MAIPEIGPKVAASIRRFFAEARNRQVVEGLLAAGVNSGAMEEGEGARPLAEGLCLDRYPLGIYPF